MKKTFRKFLCILLCLSLLLPLAGCWNYRGLNEMTIVAGMAIDKTDGEYDLTFEIMDMQRPTKTEGPSSELIHSKGDSLMDAIRNAKRQLSNKLYFGNMQIVIVSQKIAREDGLSSFLDNFLRDAEMRETMQLIVSREEDAGSLLVTHEKQSGAASYDIMQIILDDAKVTGSTFSTELYHVYNELNSPGTSIALPAFYMASEPDSEEKHAEANGCAIFRDDKMVDFLSPEQTKYVLMMKEHLSGGVLTVYLPDLTPHNISLEITGVEPSLSYEINDSDVSMHLEVVLHTYLNEYPHRKNDSSSAVIEPVTQAAEKMVEEKLSDVVKHLQTSSQADVLGFGNHIYRTNLPFWKTISADWDTIYQTIPVTVTAKIHILNTAMIRDS